MPDSCRLVSDLPLKWASIRPRRSRARSGGGLMPSQSPIPPPPRPRPALVGLTLFIAAIAGAVLVVACSERRSRGSGARAAEPAAVPPSPAATQPTEPVITGPVSFERADSAFRERRYSEAVSLFALYTAGKPANPWGHYMLGLSAWRAGDRETAEQEFNKTIELDSMHVKARLNLSRILIETGRAKGAFEPLQTVLRLDSTATSAYRLLGRAYDAVARPTQRSTPTSTPFCSTTTTPGR